MDRRLMWPGIAGPGLGRATPQTWQQISKQGKPAVLPAPKMEIRQVRSLDGRLDVLEQLVRAGIRSPIVRAETVWVVSQCPDRNDGCEVASVFWYAKSNVRYTQDIIGIDTYQTAVRTLQFKGGDCDDSAVLLCSMLAAIGFQVGFRVISTTGESWEHIYALVGMPKKDPKGWLPLDTTVPSSVPGWEPPAHQVRARKDRAPLKLV